MKNIDWEYAGHGWQTLDDIRRDAELPQLRLGTGECMKQFVRVYGREDGMDFAFGGYRYMPRVHIAYACKDAITGKAERIGGYKTMLEAKAALAGRYGFIETIVITPFDGASPAGHPNTVPIEATVPRAAINAEKEGE